MALPKDGFAAVQQELSSERAGAMARLGATIDRLVAELEALEASLPGVTLEHRSPICERHEQIRREAEKYLWYLIVTREAIGLRHHDVVYELYRVPRRLK